MNMKSERVEEERKLLLLWLSRRYWDSCCLDEAIDWSNHQTCLDNPREAAEYVEWRSKVKDLTLQLRKLIGEKGFSEVAKCFYK